MSDLVLKYNYVTVRSPPGTCSSEAAGEEAQQIEAVYNDN